MSEKHLQRYIDEFAFRLNMQDGEYTETFAEAVRRKRSEHDE